MLDFNIQDDEIKCPYCGYEFSDSWEYGKGESVIECECGKDFHYYGEPRLDMRVAKDCELNKEEHEFKPYYKDLLKCDNCGATKLKDS
jgi:hypothetical protein